MGPLWRQRAKQQTKDIRDDQRGSEWTGHSETGKTEGLATRTAGPGIEERWDYGGI